MARCVAVAVGPAAVPVAAAAPKAKAPPLPQMYIENNITCPEILRLLQEEGCGKIVRKRKARASKKAPATEALETLGTPAEDMAALRDARIAGDLHVARLDGRVVDDGDASDASDAEAEAEDAAAPAKKRGRKGGKPKKTKAAKAPAAVEGHGLHDVREVGTLRCAKAVVMGPPKEPLEEMTDSSELLAEGDYASLWRRFEGDGYVLLRGVLDPAAVVEARRAFTRPLVVEGQIEELGKLLDDVVEAPVESLPPAAAAAEDEEDEAAASARAEAEASEAEAAARRARLAALRRERATPGSEGYTVMISSGEAIRGRKKHLDDSQSDAEKIRWKRACQSRGARAATEDEGLERAMVALARGRALFEAQLEETADDDDRSASERSESLKAKRLAAHAKACGVDFCAEADAALPYMAPPGVRAEAYRVAFFDPKFTWVRLKAPGEQTVEHADVYHFERETGLFTGAPDDVSPAPALYEPPDDAPCVACGSADDGDRMLICDECDACQTGR